MLKSLPSHVFDGVFGSREVDGAIGDWSWYRSTGHLFLIPLLLLGYISIYTWIQAGEHATKALWPSFMRRKQCLSSNARGASNQSNWKWNHEMKLKVETHYWLLTSVNVKLNQSYRSRSNWNSPSVSQSVTEWVTLTLSDSLNNWVSEWQKLERETYLELDSRRIRDSPVFHPFFTITVSVTYTCS